LLKQLSDVLAQLRLQPLRLGEEPLRLGDAIREALADRVDAVGDSPFLLHSSQPVPPRSQGGNGLLLGVVPPDVIPLAT